MELDEARIAALGRRLAIAEREPDEDFVARIDMAREAGDLARQARSARREEILIEILAGAGLLAAVNQLLAVGEGAADLLMPLATGLGALALAWAAAWLFLAMVVAAPREGLA